MADVTEGYIPVAGTDANLDTTVVEQTDGSLTHREAVVLADPADNDARANVQQASDDRDDYAVKVRMDNALSTDEALNLIYRELRLLNIRFEEAFDTKISQLGVEDLSDEN